MNLDIIRKIFPEKAKLIQEGKCPECGESVDHSAFRDELSRKEFKINQWAVSA